MEVDYQVLIWGVQIILDTGKYSKTWLDTGCGYCATRARRKKMILSVILCFKQNIKVAKNKEAQPTNAKMHPY